MKSLPDALKFFNDNYKIVGDPIYLSTFFKEGGDELIFQHLSSLYKAEYQPEEKIIVIQDCDDQYDYEHLPGNSLVFLQKCLQTLDISNFFVTVVTGNQDIESELNTLQQDYSIDDCTINHVLINIPYKRKIEKSDTFCILPWIHLSVHSDSKVYLCCASNKNIPLGDLQKEKVADIINNEHFQTVRSRLLSNKKTPECSYCYHAERHGIESPRLTNLKRWERYNTPEIFNKTVITDFKPVYLDLRFSNACNLQCRTCSGEYSSMIAAEEKALFDNYTNFKKVLTLGQRETAFAETFEYLDSVEEIYFTGGEPLIMFETYKILYRLIELKKFDVKLYFNTNFNTLKFKNQNILELWKKFKNIELYISVDGHGPVVEYVRHGCKWSNIENNLSLVQKECPHVNISVLSTISFLSLQSVIELQKQWHTQGKLSIKNFRMNIMANASEDNHSFSASLYNLQTLRKEFKKPLADLIDNHCKWLQELDVPEIINRWKQIKNYMLDQDREYAIANLKEVHKLRDHYRNENFDHIFPEFKGLFD